MIQQKIHIIQIQTILNSKEDGDAYLTNSSEYIKNIKEKVNVYDLTKVKCK